MSLEQKVLELAIQHWNRDFTGISAISIAEKLGHSHLDVLNAVRTLSKSGKGTLNDNVTLYPVSISLKEGSVSTEHDKVITAVFFPSREALEEHFKTSDLIKKDLPEYKVRMHRGYSQLHLIYFSIEVLRKYLSHLELYSFDDSVAGGTIGPNREYLNQLSEEDADKVWFYLDYGKRRLSNGEIAVTAILNDLGNLPFAEQRHWHSHEISNPTFADEDDDFAHFVLRNFEGEWIDYDDPLEQSLQALVSVNERTDEEPIFRNTENPYLSFPLSNTYKDFCDSCSELYKLVGPDNINANSIRNMLRTYFGYADDNLFHPESKKPLSTLQILKLLSGKYPNGLALIEVIEEIKIHRIQADHKIVQPEITNQNYIDEFRAICNSLHIALRHLNKGVRLMTEPMSREEAFDHLHRWMSALARITDDILPQVRDALEGKTSLPKGCPSRESLAALIFSQIHKKLREVNAAVVMAETAIWDTTEEAMEKD